MSAQTYRISVERIDGDAVQVDVITPDGEFETIGVVQSPAQLLSFGPAFAAYMSSLIVNAVWEAKGA